MLSTSTNTTLLSSNPSSSSTMSQKISYPLPRPTTPSTPSESEESESSYSDSSASASDYEHDHHHHHRSSSSRSKRRRTRRESGETGSDDDDDHHHRRMPVRRNNGGFDIEHLNLQIGFNSSNPHLALNQRHRNEDSESEREDHSEDDDIPLASRSSSTTPESVHNQSINNSNSCETQQHATTLERDGTIKGRKKAGARTSSMMAAGGGGGEEVGDGGREKMPRIESEGNVHHVVGEIMAIDPSHHSQRLDPPASSASSQYYPPYFTSTSTSALPSNINIPNNVNHSPQPSTSSPAHIFGNKSLSRTRAASVLSLRRERKEREELGKRMGGVTLEGEEGEGERMEVDIDGGAARGIDNPTRQESMPVHQPPSSPPPPPPTHLPPSPSTSSLSALPPSSPTASTSKPKSKKRHVDLATYPSAELLKLLAKLLGQITAANDQLPPVQERMRGLEEERERRRREKEKEGTDNAAGEAGKGKSTKPPSPTHAPSTSSVSSNLPPTRTPLSASSSALSSTQSHLCFHARNIPNISIENYLTRILKYCPMTNEVFLSLLVYFDRMARLGEEDEDGSEVEGGGCGRVPFAIDSFNVHRLIIAGVTVASKFFSDVFYTNSRYAKVGGLPTAELNQLELQFLLLNDFQLLIPLEEMQRYADQLLVWWPMGIEEPESEDEGEEGKDI